jgi:hypothetical protein
MKETIKICLLVLCILNETRADLDAFEDDSDNKINALKITKDQLNDVVAGVEVGAFIMYIF